MNMYQGLTQLKTYLELFKKESISYDKLKEAAKEFSALLAFVSMHLETPKDTHKKRHLFFCLSPPFFNTYQHKIGQKKSLETVFLNSLAHSLDTFLLLFKPLCPYFSSYLFLETSRLLIISTQNELKKNLKQHVSISVTTSNTQLSKCSSILENPSVIYFSNDSNALNQSHFLKQNIIEVNIKQKNPLWLIGKLNCFSDYENTLKTILESGQLNPKTCFEICLSEAFSTKTNHDLSTLLFLFEKYPYSLYFKASNLFLTSYLLLRVASLNLNNIYFSFDYLYPNNLALCLDLLDQKTLIHTKYYPKNDLNYLEITNKTLHQKAKEFKNSKHSLKPLFTKRVGTDLWHQLCNAFLD